MCVIVGLVPIVRGKFPRYEKHVPPGSFINADSFFSYADLAEYLKYLMQTPEAYNKFFEWRRWVRHELYGWFYGWAAVLRVAILVLHMASLFGWDKFDCF